MHICTYVYELLNMYKTTSGGMWCTLVIDQFANVFVCENHRYRCIYTLLCQV